MGGFYEEGAALVERAGHTRQRHLLHKGGPYKNNDALEERVGQTRQCRLLNKGEPNQTATPLWGWAIHGNILHEVPHAACPKGPKFFDMLSIYFP